MAFQEGGKKRSKFDTGATDGEGVTPEQRAELDKEAAKDNKETK